MLLLWLLLLLLLLLISREYDETMQWTVNEAIFKCVVENDLAGLKTYVESGEDVNARNDEVLYV